MMSRQEKNKIILSKSETEKTAFLKKTIFEWKFLELIPTKFQFSFENKKISLRLEGYFKVAPHFLIVEE